MNITIDDLRYLGCDITTLSGQTFKRRRLQVSPFQTNFLATQCQVPMLNYIAMLQPGWTNAQAGLFVYKHLTTLVQNSINDGSFGRFFNSLLKGAQITFQNANTTDYRLFAITSSPSLLSTSSPKSDSNGLRLSAGALAGIIVGVISGLISILVIIYFFCCRKKTNACFSSTDDVESVASTATSVRAPSMRINEIFELNERLKVKSKASNPLHENQGKVKISEAYKEILEMRSSGENLNPLVNPESINVDQSFPPRSRSNTPPRYVSNMPHIHEEPDRLTVKFDHSKLKKLLNTKSREDSDDNSSVGGADDFGSRITSQEYDSPKLRSEFSILSSEKDPENVTMRRGIGFGIPELQKEFEDLLKELIIVMDCLNEHYNTGADVFSLSPLLPLTRQVEPHPQSGSISPNTSHLSL